MWLRSLGVVLLSAFVFQGSFPADTAQTLRERYGQPISETYLVRPGVVVAASYGPSGHICNIVLSPERLWNSTFESKELTEIIDELVPANERGKLLMGTFLNAVCLPTNDRFGTASTYEKVHIARFGGTDAEHYARIEWLRDECRSSKKLSPGQEPPSP
jgi:hypothetical protein